MNDVQPQGEAFSWVDRSLSAPSDGGSGSIFTAARQRGSEICGAVHQAMESSSVGESPKFVEHLVVASVADFVEGMMESLVQDMNVAMALPGVLATHMGRCELMLGEEHSFMVHIRAVDNASCEAAYRAASEVYEKHMTLHDMKLSDGHFGDSIVVKFHSNLIGAWDLKWPAIRIAIFQYKSDTSEERKQSLITAVGLLPSLFPCVKQVSWGRNVAKGRIHRDLNGYADADLGVILGFSCCQDMHALGADPKYWELLNFHGISILEHYQVLTLCTA